MDENYAYISINGKEDVSLVSIALNLEPTDAWNVGDKRKNGSIYDFSHWEYRLPEFEQEFMDESLRKVVEFIEAKKLKFNLIPDGFKAFISCAGFHEQRSQGFHLSADLIKKLGLIGIAVDFDLYCHNE